MRIEGGKSDVATEGTELRVLALINPSNTSREARRDIIRKAAEKDRGVLDRLDEPDKKP